MKLNYRIIILAMILIVYGGRTGCSTYAVDGFSHSKLARRIRDIELFSQLRQTKTLGERIGVVRQYCGFTQQKLGEMLGVTGKTVSHWENDYEEPKPSNIAKLSRVLNIDIWRLLTGFPEEEAVEEINLLPRIALIELALWEEERLIGERLKLARIAKGLEQQELAEMVGVHENYIIAWEKGHRFIPQEKMPILISILNIKPELLQEAKLPLQVIPEIEQIRPVSFMGERIKDRREELKWSREYLAGLIGVDTDSILYWENGFVDSSPENIPRLAKELRIDVWILLTGKKKGEALRRENLVHLISPIELEKWEERRIIGERMKLARLAQGYSRRKLIEKLEERKINVSEDGYGYYERGIFLLPKQIIPTLAQLLELEESELQ